MLIFQADPDLYERVRQETTVDGHGKTLAEQYRRVEVHGIAKNERAHSAAEEVETKIGMVVTKSAGGLSYDQALGVVFREDRAAGGDLYERWRLESYA